MRSGYFVLFAGYLALLLAVGLVFTRRMKSAEDYFLAGRRLSGRLICVSLTASWFGATSILISTDEAFAGGISAIWIVGVPAVATVLLLAVLFAGRVHRLPVLTWSDLVELKYGRLVRHLASGLLVWYMAMLAASQMSALGLFLRNFLDVPYGWALGAGTAVVLVYTALGGLRSVIWTDVLQFALLLAGVLALYFWASGQSSWPLVAARAAEAGKSGYFNLFHDFGRNALMALSFTLAWTISPIALQRIRAARSAAAARRGLGATAAALLGLYVLIVGIGVLSLPLFPGRIAGAGGAPLVAEIAGGRAGFALGGLVFVAVLAAILSTMDTAVNAGALVLNRDVIEQVYPGARKPSGHLGPGGDRADRGFRLSRRPEIPEHPQNDRLVVGNPGRRIFHPRRGHDVSEKEISGGRASERGRRRGIRRLELSRGLGGDFLGASGLAVFRSGRACSSAPPDLFVGMLIDRRQIIRGRSTHSPILISRWLPELR